MLDAIGALRGSPMRIVYGGGQEADPVEGIMRLAAAIRRAQAADPIDLRIVSRFGHAAIGSEDLRPDQAALVGFARVIPQEQPNIRCAIVDLDETTDGAYLAAVLSAPAPDPLTAIRGSRLWRQAFERRRPDPSASPRLRQGGVYLITGGLGRIGLALAEHLVRTVKAGVVLVGRSKPSQRSRRGSTPSSAAAGACSSRPPTSRTSRRCRT